MATKAPPAPKSKASKDQLKTDAKDGARARMRIDDRHSVGGYCSVKPEQRRNFGNDIDSLRLEAIIVSDKKWVNGTKLRYCFFDRAEDGENVLLADGSSKFIGWKGAENQKRVVRSAFEAWKKVGIGLDFAEVADRDEAEIRIGFMDGDGAWSYVGRDILNRGKNARTMNFGWDLTGSDGLDTAMHEIGHTLGMPHEHQNPHAGIVWEEEAVYRDLAGAPNFWSRETTFHNIIRKIPPQTVIGTDWDRNSIMHYPFAAGMIREPTEFRAAALVPAGGLSARDRAWIKETYPPIAEADVIRLEPFVARRLDLAAGQHFNAVFVPEETRRYTVETFGPTDMVLTVFEEEDGEPVFLAGDDDSGFDFNAKIRVRLRKGRTYLVRARLFFTWDSGASAVMVY